MASVPVTAPPSITVTDGSTSYATAYTLAESNHSSSFSWLSTCFRRTRAVHRLRFRLIVEWILSDSGDRGEL